MIRQDWAEKLGVANPKNADEVMKMFVAFANGTERQRQEDLGLPELYQSIWNAMYRVPDNWQLNKDGSLTKDLETEEFKAATDFARQLWGKGAFHPDALTMTLNQEESYFEGGVVGSFTQGSVVGSATSRTRLHADQRDRPVGQSRALAAPGESGGNPRFIQTSGNYGFGAIPTTIKDESRIMKLIHLMDCARRRSVPRSSTSTTMVSRGRCTTWWTASRCRSATATRTGRMSSTICANH